MIHTIVVSEFRSDARIVELERCKGPMDVFYRVAFFRKYHTLDEAKKAYLRELPSSCHEEQEKRIREGLRFADQRQGKETNNTLKEK